MSWEREMTEVVRVLIGDTDDTNEKYSDERLERSLLVSAYQVRQEVDFDTSYTISISQGTITPSPVPCNSTSDIYFVNLVCLKATMLIIGGETRIAANSAMDIQDGPSKISGKSRYEALKGVLDWCAAQYYKAKIDYVTGVVCPIYSSTTPSTNQNVPPDLYGQLYSYWDSPRNQTYY